MINQTNPPRSPFFKGGGAAWWLTCALASSLWCLTSAARSSATFDEPLYVKIGLEAWRSDSHAPLMRWGTMPLPADVQTLPLYAAERWRGAPFDPNEDLGVLLPWARAMNLVFWWLLLGYGCVIGTALAGPWGGRLATLLLATEPNLLAHASLATTDIAATACLLALAFHYQRGRNAGWFRRVAIPTLWFGMAVLAKASALIVGPLCLAAIESERLWRAGRLEKTELRAFARELARIVGGGLVLVCLGCGSDWRADPGFVAWANALPYAVVRGPMLALATHLRIFSNAGEALWFQVSHNLRGHGAFVLGRTDERALWYYFPVVLSLKLSEALLCAPLGVALLAPRALGNWAFLSAVVLLLWSVTFRVQLGVRMVLPLVALFAVGIAVALVRSVHAQKKWRGNAAVVTAAILSLWSMTIAIATWPHGIAYINRFWGGAEQGYRLTSDSNYDWGQGVKDLLRWQRESGIADLGVWYFGTDPEVARPPLRLVPLHVMKIDGGEDVVAAVRGCRLAVSTTLLYGTTMNEAHRHAAEFLRSQSPVARTMTFLIYDLCGGACVE